MKYTKQQCDAKLEAISAVGNLAKAIKNETFFNYNFNMLEKAIKKMYNELHDKDENIYSHPIKNVGSTNLMYIVQNLVHSITFDLNNEKYWLDLLQQYYND